MDIRNLRKILDKIRGKTKSKKLWEALFGVYELDFSNWTDEAFRELVKGFETNGQIEILWKEKKLRLHSVSSKAYIKEAKAKL